ncbi:MAG: SUF system Fe-S cluster assembly protein [Alphaproteobacteria bacterium]
MTDDESKTQEPSSGGPADPVEAREAPSTEASSPEAPSTEAPSTEALSPEALSPEAPSTEALSPEAPESADALVREQVIAALRTVYDPEIPVNIYELGLVYDVRILDAGKVEIDMTLTAPGCPVAEDMPIMVQEAVQTVEGIAEVKVEIVWDPPWDPSRMSDVARLETGFF